MESNTDPFAVMILGDFDGGLSRKKDFLLFLTLAYLLSEHVPFVFPLPNDKSRLVDAQFDDVIKGLTLKSKGIIYQKDLEAGQLQELLERTSLLLTDEIGAAKLNVDKNTPCICLKSDAQGTSVQLGSMDHLTNQELKDQLVGCVRLINILSGGFLSRGHFSLSW